MVALKDIVYVTDCSDTMISGNISKDLVKHIIKKGLSKDTLSILFHGPKALYAHLLEQRGIGNLEGHLMTKYRTLDGVHTREIKRNVIPNLTFNPYFIYALLKIRAGAHKRGVDQRRINLYIASRDLEPEVNLFLDAPHRMKWHPTFDSIKSLIQGYGGNVSAYQALKKTSTNREVLQALGINPLILANTITIEKGCYKGKPRAGKLLKELLPEINTHTKEKKTLLSMATKNIIYRSAAVFFSDKEERHLMGNIGSDTQFHSFGVFVQPKGSKKYFKQELDHDIKLAIDAIVKRLR